MIDPRAHPAYGLAAEAKERVLLDALVALTEHHREACAPYARVLAALCYQGGAHAVGDIPALPVSLFKTEALFSIPEEAIFKRVTSSGTSGQSLSQIILDRETAALQTRALATIMTDLLGPERLAMVIVDCPATLRDRTVFNARAAGILGMMNFGRQPFFALDDEMRLDRAGLARFLDQFAGRPILVFGFTWLVWKYFAPAVAEAGLRFQDATLLHSGGWKRLTQEAVDNAVFRTRVGEMTGIATVRNFYGMAEQVGSVFVEHADGLLYPPWFADVIIRDPVTLDPLPVGETGLIQVLSLLPRSYPGHSLLTEDLGVIERIDADPDHYGKGLRVLGRAPSAELRGCSDVAETPLP